MDGRQRQSGRRDRTITDPDMNINSILAETLRVQDDNVIPTIVVGSPKYLIANDIGYDGASATTTTGGLHFAASDADSFSTTPVITALRAGIKRVKLTTAAGTTGADASLITLSACRRSTV